ncbi:MAG: fibronectin type III domain-containing protein [Bacteroidales bacterium]|nr:fibronectin type III domain-containing protein [Bacteroidales bacterium]
MNRNFFIAIVCALAAAACGSKVPRKNSAPASATGLSVEQLSMSEARLSWSGPSENVTGWWVYLRSESDGFHVAPLNDDPLPASAREHVFGGLVKGKTYSLGVQALGKDMNSAIEYVEFAITEPSEEPVEESIDPSGESSDPSGESDDPSEPFSVTVDVAGRTVLLSGKSTKGEDLSIGLATVSANKTVQIDTYTIGNESFKSCTDWVGPWNMRTVATTSQTEKAWGFTGGWHGSNGDGTGDPTAVTESIVVTVDGEQVTSGTFTAREASCTVYNKVEAANTKFADAKRFTIDETVTYTFKGGRLYVRMEATAREDLNVTLYYGMQIANGFCNKFSFTTEDGSTTESGESYFAKGIVRDMTGYSAGGHCVVAHLDDEGLGTYSLATPAYSALTQYYGVNNGKGYYMLIGDKDGSSKSFRFKKDVTIYWSGYYEFR